MLVDSPLGIAGDISGDVYYTERKPNHFMRKFQGFGISQSVLDKLKEKGVKSVIIKYYRENGGITFFKCEAEKFYISKKSHPYENKDRITIEIDWQRFVSYKDMDIIVEEDENGKAKI